MLAGISYVCHLVIDLTIGLPGKIWRTVTELLGEVVVLPLLMNWKVKDECQFRERPRATRQGRHWLAHVVPTVPDLCL